VALDLEELDLRHGGHLLFDRGDELEVDLGLPAADQDAEAPRGVGIEEDVGGVLLGAEHLEGAEDGGQLGDVVGALADELAVLDDLAVGALEQDADAGGAGVAGAGAVGVDEDGGRRGRGLDGVFTGGRDDRGGGRRAAEGLVGDDLPVALDEVVGGGPVGFGGAEAVAHLDTAAVHDRLAGGQNAHEHCLILELELLPRHGRTSGRRVGGGEAGAFTCWRQGERVRDATGVPRIRARRTGEKARRSH
jgi:hypothetical protein